MSCSFLFPSNSSLVTTRKSITSPTSLPPYLLSTSSRYITFNKRDFVLPISVTSPSVAYPQPPFNVEYLQIEFGSHGVSFAELGQSSYVIRMLLENGSAASILMPSGLITSYKPKMWHGSSIEVLHTSVSERGAMYGDGGGGPIIQGGVSLALKCVGENGFSWSPLSWILTDVKGSSQDSIQVELISREIENMVEVKYTITLKDDTLNSEVSVLNSRSSQLELTGSILSHLTVSSPDATYAFGLEGSNYVNKLPPISDFFIMPPNLAKNKKTSPSQSWPLSSLKELFGAKTDDTEINEQTEGEEEDNYKHLSGKMSRIYTCAPRNFTIIDRGKRNSVNVGRRGFGELYMYSPGSSHELYGKYAYLCVGQSALLKPITLGPEQSWKGEQRLHNPNL
ncbi:protein NDH-DEPENDENT CYCLIC ELECTRON FLOW 5-like [Chenopodium quinoa]|uniref:protein NDH-DEPENDENT CYCLIC ELECTRON FLOW 5-like n=1 Tax=Chenopodium quinoa TaxID=63459 RepID=UPI000B79A597|nr:protein NDH-DEPENDENT CYCLIC ELECTRON FLOW 5-like [Chenopodium quinoa]